MDYNPEKPEIVVDEEYESATNLTKDAKDNEGKRVKRSVVAETEDGVLVNSESYAEVKAKNSTHKKRVNRFRDGKTVTATRAKSSAFG